MSRRIKKSRDYREYLSDEVDSSSLENEQVNNSKIVPYKTLAFIFVFFIMGSICICFGILTISGYFGEEFQDRGLPSLLIGILMFIPGGYYVYILIFILCKREGFTFEDIPML
ncbi:hypothetical protein ACFFRR_005321 [Megaselia abdita]